jgi:hypothetical protein
VNKEKSSAKKEYLRRVRICENAIFRAAKCVGFEASVSSEYQGCGMPIKTEVYAEGEVIVLVTTGCGPRLPKYVSLTVHGVIWHRVNSRVYLSGHGLGTSTKDFLPNKISTAWLKTAILNAANVVREKCTAKNIALLREQALARRRQMVREGNRMLNTYFDVN